jgi:tetratricopeptide (TPR) repeat protein
MNQPDSAWMTNQQAAALSDHADDSQHALLLRHRAYYELQLDSFDNAAQHAYQSAIVAQDSTSMGEALALLCAAYIRQGNDTQAELVMRTMPGQGGAMQRNRLLLQGEYMEGKGDYEGAMKAYKRLVAINDSLARMQRNVEMVSLQERYDREVISREKAEQRIWYSLAIIALLFVVFGAWLILSRRHRRIYRRYHEGLRNMNRQLGARELTISELKADIDRRLAEMQTLKQQLSQFSSQTARREVEEIFTSVSDTKAGIDVLYAIVSGQNISQYGKREETALRQILQPVNPQLAAHIDSATQPLTPKEVFYCVMQHYGMTDEEKIQAFCCTPQALRSIKSRLGKKM